MVAGNRVSRNHAIGDRVERFLIVVSWTSTRDEAPDGLLRRVVEIGQLADVEDALRSARRRL
jgi:hypothetical protein